MILAIFENELRLVNAKKKYEAWADDEGISLGLASGFFSTKSQALLGPNPELLYSFYADTPEEASAVHHIKMGWEPYVSMGSAKLCPNKCQSYFYPEGSGVCPKCGDVR